MHLGLSEKVADSCRLHLSMKSSVFCFFHESRRKAAVLVMIHSVMSKCMECAEGKIV